MRSKPYVDFYKVLGLATNASAEDIKQSYRNLAKQFHPDRNPSPEAHEQFVEINEAYETLSDPMKRNRYDYFWRHWEESRQRRAANQGSASYSKSPHHQTTNTTQGRQNHYVRYKRKTEEKLPNWFLAYAKLIRWFVFLTAIIGIVASLDLFLHGKVGVDQVEDIHWSDDTFQIGLKNHGSFDIPFIPQELNKEDSVEVYYSLFFQKVNAIKAVSSPFRHRVLFNNRYNLGILLFTLAILASIHIVVLNSDKVFVACIGTLDLLWFYLLIKLIVNSSPLF